MVYVFAPAIIYQDYLYSIFGAKSILYSSFIVRVSLLDNNWIWQSVNANNSYQRFGFSFNGEGYKFYSFGGGTAAFYNDLNLFNFESNCASTIDVCINISNISPIYFYPPPRADHALVQINSYLYLFGGIGFNGYYSDMWQFDTVKEIWNSINQEGNIPSARHLFAYSSFGNTLAIFGGEGSLGLENDLYLFNGITNIWTSIVPLPSSPVPSGRKGTCAVFDLPYIYIYGGQTLNGISNELWQFNIGTSEYILLSTSDLGHTNANCQIVNNIFNIYFGLDSYGNSNTTIKRYDLSTNQWFTSQFINANTGGESGIAITIDNYFICYGGTSFYLESFSEIYAQSETGLYSAPTNFTPYSMAFAFFNSFLYISGGGSINLYQQLAPELYSSFLGYIDVNYTFQEVIIPCSPGTTALGTLCIPCDIGTYSDSFSNTPCTLCKMGTYLSVTGANSQRQCLFCPQNTFNNKLGSSKCLECTQYQYCPIGSISPQNLLNFTASTSIQPLNFNDIQNSNLISQIQLIIAIGIIAIAIVLIVVYIEKVKAFDLYTQNHNYKYNMPMILQKTTFGGAFSLLFFAYAIILISSAGLSYIYENISEIKALQPLVILEAKTKYFYANIKVEISLMQYLDNCHFADGLIYLNISGIMNSKDNSNDSFNYYRLSNGSCLIIYDCNNCYLESDAYILVNSDESTSYASGLSVAVTSTSSIPEKSSYFQQGILADDSHLFAGSSATIFSFSMIPSYFESDSSSYPSSSTGYHISQDSPPQSGSQHLVEDLSTIKKLLVLLNFPLASYGLFTTRYMIQGFFVMISMLLGSISGALSAIRFLMSFSEKKYIDYTSYRKHKLSTNDLIKKNGIIKQYLAKRCLSDSESFKINSCREIEDAPRQQNLILSSKITLKL